MATTEDLQFYSAVIESTGTTYAENAVSHPVTTIPNVVTQVTYDGRGAGNFTNVGNGTIVTQDTVAGSAAAAAWDFNQLTKALPGRVVAVLGPADASARGHRLTRLEQMIADRTARPPLKDGNLPDDWPATTIRLPKGTAAALIDADREED